LPITFPQLKGKQISSQVALTDKQISAIDEHADEFRASNYETREKIVKEFFDSFKATQPWG
jgi:hypothetical protein